MTAASVTVAASHHSGHKRRLGALESGPLSPHISRALSPRSRAQITVQCRRSVRLPVWGQHSIRALAT